MKYLIQKLLVAFALTHTELLSGADARNLERNSLRHEHVSILDQSSVRRNLQDEEEAASEVDLREYAKRSYIKFMY